MTKGKNTTIALVANSTWNFFNFRMNIVKAIIDRGYDVVLISPKDEYLEPLLEKFDVQHISLVNLRRKGTNPVREFLLINEFKKIYKKINPDLVIHFTIKPNIYGNYVAKKLGIKSICVVTGLGYVFLHETYFSRIAKLLYKYSFTTSDLVVFENKDDKDLFIEQGLIAADKASYVKGCGVNLDYYKPLLDSRKNNNKTIFTFIGRLMYDKGIVEFINAAEELKSSYKNVEFWLVGEIDDGNPASINNQQLIDWVESGIVKYFGQIKDIRPLIQKSDCVVLPSYREGMSRLLTEAIAMEKPVISSDTPGCKDIVDDGENGFLVPIKNSEALLEAFVKFLDLDEPERQSMGKKGRLKAINEFDDQVIANQFLSFIDSVD